MHAPHTFTYSRTHVCTRTHTPTDASFINKIGSFFVTYQQLIIFTDNYFMQEITAT